MTEDVIRFTVVQDFHSDELESDYCAGMTYQAGPEDDRLWDLIPRWIKEGKIVEGGVAAIVEGKG